MIVIFSLSALWWRMIRGLWKLPDGRDRLRGKLGLILMDWAMLSKPLIQFSVKGCSCAPSLLFTWGQTVVEVMKIMVMDNGTSFKRSHVCTATLSAPKPASVHHWPTPLPENHGQVWVSLLWGHCSFLLCPGAHKVLSVPFKSLFPQSYGSSGSSMVGLLAFSSKRTYSIPKSAALRAPTSAAVHCWPVPPQETLKHSSVSVSVGSLCLPQTGGNRFQSWRAQTKPCVHKESEERSSDSTGNSTKTTC